MASIFDTVKGIRPKKNVFNLDHTFIGSFDIGEVVPVFSMQDVLPGSKIKVSTGQLTRFQALLAPIMHRIDAYITFWCVPYRLIDPNFPKFVSGEFEFDKEEYNAPYFTYSGLYDSIEDNQLLDGTLLDFFGYPTRSNVEEASSLSDSTIKMTPRPIVGYLLILRQWYINENVLPDTFALNYLFSKGGSFDTLLNKIAEGGDCSVEVAQCLNNLYSLSPSMCFPHGWNKDYFTSALPFTQVGSPVVLPIAGIAPVTGTVPVQSTRLDEVRVGSYGSLVPGTVSVGSDSQGVPDLQDSAGNAIEKITGTQNALQIEGEADLSQATSFSIIQLRIANALQSYKERIARQGHRYIEYLLGTWGVVSQDARLQLPQWLASGRVPVAINPVEQTSATTNSGIEGDTTPAGNLTARATGVGTSFCDFTMYNHEDSMILGLLYIQPKTMYGNRGVNRHLLKVDDRFDFLDPTFEHIGEQEIKNCELFLSGTDETDNGVFGYTARYAEYKCWNDEVHGQFNNVLAFWHMARIFNTTPTLSPDFLYIKQSDVSRPFAVQEVTDPDDPTKKFPLNNSLNMLHFKVKYIAPMSHYGTPKLLN